MFKSQPSRVNAFVRLWGTIKIIYIRGEIVERERQRGRKEGERVGERERKKYYSCTFVLIHKWPRDTTAPAALNERMNRRVLSHPLY